MSPGAHRDPVLGEDAAVIVLGVHEVHRGAGHRRPGGQYRGMYALAGYDRGPRAALPRGVKTPEGGVPPAAIEARRGFRPRILPEGSAMDDAIGVPRAPGPADPEAAARRPNGSRPTAPTGTSGQGSI